VGGGWYYRHTEKGTLDILKTLFTHANLSTDREADFQSEFLKLVCEEIDQIPGDVVQFLI
jgi:hypothetical protein